ncbi:MAG: PepSY domain-containing protein [Rhodospirillales bacterium]|nr:PepSY domain-containing protein [Rhodospirillales bacterium]
MKYRYVRRLHLVLSLGAALPLLLLSLTGVLLVYGHELQDWISPEHWVAAGPSADAAPLPYSELIERIADEKPDVRVWSFGIGRDPNRAWTLWLADGAGILNIDPYTGTILDHYKNDESPYGFVVALHRRWLTGDPVITPGIRHFISFVSLVLIGQVLVGLALWLMPAKRMQRLKVDFSRKPRTVVLRLHQLTGVATAVILIAVAFTGMSLYWHGPIETVVETVTGQEIRKRQEPDMTGVADIRDIDAAVRVGRSAFPDQQVLHFRAPQPGKALSMGIGGDDRIRVNQVWVGDVPPRVLAIDRADDLDAANWFWRARYWIHTGDFAGPVVRALWLIVALLPAGYVLSGLWLYLARRKARAG